MDVIARLPSCEGQAADAVSAYTQVKLEDAPKFQSQSVQMFGYVFHDKKKQNHGRKLSIPWYLLNEIYSGLLSQIAMGKAVRASFIRTWMGKKFRTGNVCSFIANNVLFCQYVDDIKLAGKKQNLAPMWKKFRKNVDIDEPTSFLDHVYLGCTQSECKPKETIIEQYTKMFESRFSAGATENITGVAETSRTNGSVVPRHGGTRSKMR